MSRITRELSLESAIALGMVFDSNFDETLTTEQSIHNISNNIIGIHHVLPKAGTRPNKTSDYSVNFGSGLLLTSNGYILSAYHVVKDMLAEWQRGDLHNVQTNEEYRELLSQTKNRYFITTHTGEKYPLDFGIFNASPTYDIALIKALIPDRPKPILFTTESVPPKPGDIMNLYAITDGRLSHEQGRVHLSTVTARTEGGDCLDTFSCFIRCLPGNSGGPVINRFGNFSGIAVASNYKKNPSQQETTIVKSSNIRDFIRFVSYQQKKNY